MKLEDNVIYRDTSHIRQHGDIFSTFTAGLKG